MTEAPITFVRIAEGQRRLRAAPSSAGCWSAMSRCERGAKRHAESGGGAQQPTLLSHIRPKLWTGHVGCLSADALGLVVEALMRAGDARSVRSLAVSSRKCAEAVRMTLLCARARLQASSSELVDAHGANETASTRLSCSSWHARRTTAESQIEEARQAYEQCMVAVGIGKHRRFHLHRHVERRRFHSAASVLGHVQGGCELCSSCLAQDSRGAGTVSLFSCLKCARANRVRFKLLKPADDVDDESWEYDPSFVQARFPRVDSVANNYACALLSKRAMHRRRMRAHRSSEATTVSLSLRVHRIEYTHTLTVLWDTHYDESHESDVSTSNFMDFELWHTLPPGIPHELSFAAVMGVERHAGDEALAQATKHGRARLCARAEMEMRLARFKKLLRDHQGVVSDVEAVIPADGFMGWIRVLDLVSAARAWDLRWLFRAELSRFGDWRTARYKVLDVDPGALRDLMHRVSAVAKVLRSTLAHEGHSLRDNCSTRACVLEIVKHLPTPILCLTTDSLEQVVAHLRKCRMTLHLRGPLYPGGSTQSLWVALQINPALLRRQQLVLKIVVTKYVASSIRACTGYGTTQKTDHLTDEVVRTLGYCLNGHLSPSWREVADQRDDARAMLFGLPGAWPSATAWAKSVACI